ncbi:MAG: carboxymuconolactone decarboxylase family protein [Pseudomonadota bacterium]
MPSIKSDAVNLAPVPIADWDPSLAHIVEDMNGAPFNVHSLMANHPDLLKAWWSFRNYSVQGGQLGRRRGELVILRVAVLLRAWYEWASHVQRALSCGVSRDDIERVKQGAQAPEWDEGDALLLQAVDELVGGHAIAPETLKKLSHHYSAQQIMDIMAIQGMYVILGGMINTWGLDLDAHMAERLPEDVTEESFEAGFSRPD